MTKHISYTCECKFDTRKWNLHSHVYDKFQCECKNPKEHYVCEKDHAWHPATCTCENVTSFISDAVVTCNEFTDKVQKQQQQKLLQEEALQQISVFYWLFL